MPRRNQHPDSREVGFSDGFVETIPPVIKTRLETREERDKRIDAEFGRRRERQNRRTDERVADALTDWTICCIPGCESKLGHYLEKSAPCDVHERLPICLRHQAIIADMHDPLAMQDEYMRVRQRLARQRVEAAEAQGQCWDLKWESNGAEQGQIYFVRLNGLVKVGWASKLRSRLKAYGADVEVLCHYPASRQDETLLHRQLRPYLAKGREWYQDCKLIADVVAETVKRHGEPSIFPTWTQPKPDVICKRR